MRILGERSKALLVPPHFFGFHADRIDNTFPEAENALRIVCHDPTKDGPRCGPYNIQGAYSRTTI